MGTEVGRQLDVVPTITSQLPNHPCFLRTSTISRSNLDQSTREPHRGVDLDKTPPSVRKLSVDCDPFVACSRASSVQAELQHCAEPHRSQRLLFPRSRHL